MLKMNDYELTSEDKRNLKWDFITTVENAIRDAEVAGLECEEIEELLREFL